MLVPDAPELIALRTVCVLPRCHHADLDLHRFRAFYPPNPLARGAPKLLLFAVQESSGQTHAAPKQNAFPPCAHGLRQAQARQERATCAYEGAHQLSHHAGLAAELYYMTYIRVRAHTVDASQALERILMHISNTNWQMISLSNLVRHIALLGGTLERTVVLPTSKN